MNFLIFFSDYGFDKVNVLLELMKSYFYRFFFWGYFICVMSLYFIYVYVLVVIDCKNVYFFFVFCWVKFIM